MDRLVETLAVGIERGRGEHAQRPRQHGGHVGQDVAEHVARHQDIELLGRPHQLHRGVVDVEMVEPYVRVVGMHLVHHVAPELGHLEHVGLVHRGQAAVALGGEIERHARDAGDLVLVVDVGVVAPTATLVGVHAAWFAEVDAARQLPDDEDVETRDKLRAQRRSVRQGLEQHRRAQVRERLQTRAHAEQAFLRALIHGQSVPLGAAHGAEQHRVGIPRGGQGRRRQWRAVVVDRDAAEIGVFVAERHAERIEHAQHVGHDLCPDCRPPGRTRMR